jgi:hypothetical protein
LLVAPRGFAPPPPPQVRDQRVRLGYCEEVGVTVVPLSKEERRQHLAADVNGPEGRDGAALPPVQFVTRITMSDWDMMCAIVAPGAGLMPHRGCGRAPAAPEALAPGSPQLGSQAKRRRAA